MATRSLIGLEKKDGMIEYVYCHFDGYPEYQLTMLTNHYNQREKVEKLIAKGSMRQLVEEIEEIEFYDEIPETYKAFSSAAYQGKIEKHGVDFAYYLGKDDKWHYYRY